MTMRDAGWHWSRLEIMAFRQNLYRLKPRGPHRNLAERLFAEHRIRCVDYDGRGLLDDDAGQSFKVCGFCSGAGFLLQLSEMEFDAIRATVVAKFPEAGVDPRLHAWMRRVLSLRERRRPQLGRGQHLHDSPGRRQPVHAVVAYPGNWRCEDGSADSGWSRANT